MGRRGAAIFLCLASLWGSAAFASPDSTSRLKEAEDAYAGGDFQSVLRILASDNSTPALILKGRTMLDAETDDYIEFFHQASSQSSSDCDVLAWNVLPFIRLKDYRGAIRQGQLAVKFNPNSALAHSMLGKALCKGGHTQSGMVELNKAIALDSKLGMAYKNLADAYSDALDGSREKDILSKLVALYPNRPGPLIWRANAFQDMGLPKYALEDYSKAIALNPHCQLAYLKRASLLTVRTYYQDAIRDCGKVLAEGRAFADMGDKALRVREKCYAMLGQYPKAIEDLDVLLKTVPQKKGIDGSMTRELLERATYLEKLKHYHKALESVEWVLHFKPKTTEALLMKAQLHSEMGNNELALGDFDVLLKIDDTIADWHKGRAEVYKKMGNEKAAQFDLRRAKELEDAM